MKPEVRRSVMVFLIELVVYAGLVTGYFFLVLTFLADWLNRIFETQRQLYAALALVLIIIQGVLFEALTRFLLSLVKPRTED
ncbi:MAG: hypothetical protein C5B50_28570 [Verrucomicrobia bacterium]|nr:MAG: hypothetical protein C5B50_28570 [Verrucomicrobiota bacterium]